MITIGVDTAARVGGVAVVKDGALLGQFVMGKEESHSEYLLPSLEALLERLSIRMEDVGAIGVSIGPGSFTGLRIGLAAVKGIAFARAIPVVGVSTLLATAWSMAGAAGMICSSLDARRESVFAGLFAGERLREDRRPVEPEARVAVAELAGRLVGLLEEGTDVYLVGDGSSAVARAVAAELSGRGVKGRLVRVPMDGEAQRPANVACIGEVESRQGARADLVELVPNYLRLSEAERRWKQMRS